MYINDVKTGTAAKISIGSFESNDVWYVCAAAWEQVGMCGCGKVGQPRVVSAYPGLQNYVPLQTESGIIVICVASGRLNPWPTEECA